MWKVTIDTRTRVTRRQTTVERRSRRDHTNSTWFESSGDWTVEKEEVHGLSQWQVQRVTLGHNHQYSSSLYLFLRSNQPGVWTRIRWGRVVGIAKLCHWFSVCTWYRYQFHDSLPRQYLHLGRWQENDCQELPDRLVFHWPYGDYTFLGNLWACNEWCHTREF